MNKYILVVVNDTDFKDEIGPARGPGTKGVVSEKRHQTLD
jgi:hypothetical protein